MRVIDGVRENYRRPTAGRKKGRNDVETHFFGIYLFVSFLFSSEAKGPTILRHGGTVNTVAFSPVDASRLASAGDTHTVKINEKHSVSGVSFAENLTEREVVENRVKIF